jgi:opacity protein-like surface antigen
MSVKQTSVGSVVRKGFLVTTVLAVCAAPALAQQGAVSVPPAAPAAQTAAPPPPAERSRNGWVAAVLAGTNFQANTDRANVDLDNLDDIDVDNDYQGAASFAFSGQIGYLWNYVGLEALFDFTPSVDVTRLEFEDPSANSYMGNLIVAIPTGRERKFLPYVSGGLGAISMSTSSQNMFFPGILADAVDFPGASQTKFGWNLGIGASAFGAGAFGVRGDVRYFRAGSSSNSDVFDADDILEDALDGVLEPGTADTLTRELLSGIAYWRANLGLAFRW